jgi:hypothetical protein
VDHEKAFRSTYVAERGQRMADDGELHEEEDAVVELDSLASVANASSCKRALVEAGTMAV